MFLVEDNVGDAALVRHVIAECHIPIRLRIARDGLQALQMLADPRYYKLDLIVLDLNVPKVNGLEVLRRYGPTDVPIVVFSSSQNPFEMQDALKLGAKEFVRKPIDLTSFTKALFRSVDKQRMNAAGSIALVVSDRLATDSSTTLLTPPSRFQ